MQLLLLPHLLASCNAFHVLGQLLLAMYAAQ
jgi:hypothetical protein